MSTLILGPNVAFLIHYRRLGRRSVLTVKTPTGLKVQDVEIKSKYAFRGKQDYSSLSSFRLNGHKSEARKHIEGSFIPFQSLDCFRIPKPGGSFAIFYFFPDKLGTGRGIFFSFVSIILC